MPSPALGHSANFAAYTTPLEPYNCIMGLDQGPAVQLIYDIMIPRTQKKARVTPVYFKSLPYVANPIAGLVDYNDTKRCAHMFLLKLFITGMNAYTQQWG